mmetsp:Transcript_3932/g.7828  ORF Transcript_3932/g.7828 Transcript_3932/m.7828 type:complete len:181 (-) Transcript_3932:74-616(-)
MSPREPQLPHAPSNGSLVSMEEETKPQTPPVEPHEATKVRFSTIHMRTYDRIVGDHPDVVVGPPLTFSWDYLETDAVEIDDYENTRAPKKRVLRLSSITRKNLLRNVFEASEEDIIGAEKEIQKIKKQRENTNRQSKTSTKVESALKSARKKFFRRFTRENVLKGMVAASGSGLWIQAGY